MISRSRSGTTSPGTTLKSSVLCLVWLESVPHAGTFIRLRSIMRNLFSKSKKTPNQDPSSPRNSYESGTPPSSPDKKSPKKPVRDEDSERRPSSSRPKPHHTRSDSRLSRRLTEDSHPLNRPLEELRKSSYLNAMSEPMDSDRETPAPSSPVPGKSPVAANGMNGDDRQEASPPPPPPHRTPTSPQQENGPQQSPSADAEAYKAAGNKFFKAKEYGRAIQEYSKGSLNSR